MTAAQHIPDQLIHQTLKQWQTGHDNDSDSPLLHLSLARQISQTVGPEPRCIIEELLQQALSSLAEAAPEKATLLRLRYEQNLAVHVVAGKLNMAEATLHRRQQQAIAQLAHIIAAQESRARAKYQADLDQRLLLPPAEPLIGVSDYLARLLPLLTTPGPPWLISIEGLGGIGKTALAGALLRQPDLMNYFTDLVWINAKPQSFYPGLGLTEHPQAALSPEGLVENLLHQLEPDQAPPPSLAEQRLLLSYRLKDRPTLVVVDNLETIADYQTLLPLLSQLANPGKFILTSRHSLRQVSHVHCCPVAALSLAEALAFIRQQGRHLEALAAATDADLHPIFEVVAAIPWP
jgi:hypothetical protein